MSGPGKEGGSSDSILSATHKTPTSEGPQGSSSETKENKMAYLKKSEVENVASGVIGLDRLLSGSPELLSQSKRLSFSEWINEKETRHLDSTQVSSPVFLEIGNASSGLPESGVEIPQELIWAPGNSPEKGQSFSNGLKLCTKEHNICMSNGLDLLSEGEKHTVEGTFTGDKATGSCSSPLDVKDCTAPLQHIEDIVYDNDIVAGSQECEFKTVNMKMNDIVQMQTNDALLDRLGEKESSWSEDLGSNMERSCKTTELFDQECFKKQSKVYVSRKQKSGKVIPDVRNVQVFRTTDQMDIHQINKVEADSTNNVQNRKTRKLLRKDMDDNIKVAGGYISRNNEVIGSVKGERLKEVCSLRGSNMLKEDCSLCDSNMPKEGRSLPDSNIPKDCRASCDSSVLKEGRSVRDSSVLKEYLSLRGNSIRTSKLKDRCIISNMQEEGRCLRDRTIQISKSQDRCINVKRGLKLPHSMEKEQSKQSQDINTKVVRRLDQAGSVDNVVVNPEVTSRKSSLQRRVQIIGKQKPIQGENINKQFARRLDQTRSTGSIAGSLASLNPEQAPTKVFMLKAGLKRKVKSIGKEALSERGLKDKVRNIAKEALCEAGFKIEFRPRRGRDYQDSVYVSPQGCTYWSLPNAWRAWKASQAAIGGGRDKVSTTRYGKNVQTVHKSDTKVADTTGSGTIVDKRKKRSVVDNKDLMSSGMNRVVQPKFLLEDLDSQVLRALDFPSNRGSHQQITKAELTDLFIEDLEFFKRGARLAEVGGEPELDKPIKEIEARKKGISVSSLPSKKLDFEKASGQEGTSKKRLLVSAVTDHPGGWRKRQKTEDSRLDKVSENLIDRRISSSKKPSKAEDGDKTVGSTIKGSKQRKESSSGVLWRKPVSKEMKMSHDKLRMNSPIGKPIDKDDRLSHGRLKEDTRTSSLLMKPAPKDIRVSHGRLRMDLPVTEVDKASLGRLKPRVSDLITGKRKAVCLDSFPLKSKKSKTLSGKQVVPYDKPAKNHGNRSGCRLEARSSTSVKSEGSDIQFLKNKQTVLSWLIDRGVLSEGEKLRCPIGEGDQSMKAGLATSDGILCKCCKKIFTISTFEAHAGNKLQSTCPNIVFKSGKSFLECQMQAWAIESELRKVKNYVGVTDEDRNDDTCMLCGDGGELICCDHCPSTFHTSCLQIEDVPEGNWFCPKCCCPVCGGSQYDDKEANISKSSVYLCDQCEHEYHNSCVYGDGLPTSNCWFCGPNCRKIFTGLRNLIGISHALDDGLSWTLLRCMDKDQDFKASENLEVVAKQHSKLAVALTVMQECFVPMVDLRTNVDMIPHVVYNRWSEFYRLDYRGFYTVLLEKEDELISVASIRIHGSRLAEMPLIGTRQQYRRQGMCRRLVNTIETMLSSLGVERFVLPAIPELLETWTCAFGFDPIDKVQRLNFKNLSMMVFPGTQLLQKVLAKSQHMQADTTAAIKPDFQRPEPSSCLSDLLERKQDLQELLKIDKLPATQSEGNAEHAVSTSRQETEQAVDNASRYVDIICDRPCHSSGENINGHDNVTPIPKSPLRSDKVLATQLEGNIGHSVSISRQEAEQAVDVESKDGDIICDRTGHVPGENNTEHDSAITNLTSPLSGEVKISAATENEALQVYRTDEESCVVDMDGLNKLYKKDCSLMPDQIEATVDQKTGLSFHHYAASDCMITERQETELIASSSQQSKEHLGTGLDLAHQQHTSLSMWFNFYSRLSWPKLCWKGSSFEAS